jgi:hypothetical protein
MRHRALASALLAAIVAACSGDGRVTEPVVPKNLAPLSAIGTDPATGATIETDFDDYAPGGAVYLTGRGWGPNETVHLVMTEDPDRHADVIRDVQADASGFFSLRFYEVQESDVGVRFTLVGTGASSGSNVTVQFTDQRNISDLSLSPSSPASGTTVTVLLEVVLNSGSGPTTWNGTKWEIKNAANVVVASSPVPCLNTPNHAVGDVDVSSGNKHTESFSVIAPATPGSYSLTVSVFATDNCAVPTEATVQTVNFTVVGSNTQPQLVQIGNQSIAEGSTLTFTATATDTDAPAQTLVFSLIGAPAGATITAGGAFSWMPTDGPSQTATFVVRVTDNGSPALFDEETITVTVTNVAPTATFNSPASVSAGSNINISLTAPDDASTIDETAGFTYAFDCGSGTFAAPSGTSTASCPTSGPGSKTVRGKIIDKDGGATEYSASVAIDNVPPTASAAGPYTGNEGSAVNISGSGSDPDGGLVTYEWSVVPAGVCTITNAALASTTVTCNDDFDGTLTLKVTDDEGASVTSNATLKVANVAPTITSLTAPASVNEGSNIVFSVDGITDPSTADVAAGFTYAFTCDGTTPTSFSATNSKTCPTTDNGTVTIKAVVKDDDGGTSAVFSQTVMVANVAPQVSAGADAAINEGATFTRNGSFTDPGADTWSATVDYGDGSGVQPLTLGAGKTFSLSHTYADNGVFTITVVVTDDDSGSDSDTIELTVNNVAPVVSAGADASLNEGDTFTRNGSFTDPGNDAWTATVDYGDGGGAQPLALSGKTFSLSHKYNDNGTYTVIVTVTDDDGASDTDDVTITVDNVKPIITLPLNIPVTPIAAGSQLSLTWNFTDPGDDTWECKISWDQPISFGALFASASGGTGKSCTASTSSLPAGIYTVTVYVKDDDGGYDQQTAPAYIVVYDPSAGFVTGGGWINSLPGAYRLDPSLSGKANFGFVSKYKKGMTVPDGNTEFQFHAGTLNFKSTAYDWLVVASYKAQFKGVGTINGSGTYYFLLSAIDGQINGGGGTDKFRMKIWRMNGDVEEVIYDNQLNADLDAEPTAALGGGSINIQAK